jgi:hypothetical protein
MLVKKLITLACAVGILACGACFLPPPRMHTPPPPVRPNFLGINRIRIVTSNTSPTQHLDAAQLSIWLASQISAQARGATITGFSAQQPGNEDAVLEVTILSESATPLTGTNPGDKQNWELRLSLTAVLTRNDGQVAWRESDGNYTTSRVLAKEPEPDIWKEPVVQGWLTRGVGNRLVYRMLNAH